MSNETATSSPAVSRSALRVVFFTVFLDLLGFGLVIPILPLYGESLHASDVEIGRLLAIYSMMQLLFAPILGRISDRRGRRPVLLLSIAGSCLSQIGYALAPTLGWLIVARGIAGICGANITAAQAYVADVTDEKSRAAGMGMLGAALGLGFVFGPAVGGFLSHYSHTLPFWIAAALSAVNFVSAFFILKEPRPDGSRTRARRLTWAGLMRVVTTPRILVLIVLAFVITFGFANLEATFSLFLERRFGYGRREASWLFAYIGVIIIFVQGGLVRRLAPMFGERAMVIAGTAMMAVGFFMQAQSASLALLLVAILVTSVGNALNTPALTSLISRAAGPDNQGGVLGVSQSGSALARVCGPLAGTFLLRFGEGTPFVTGGVVMAAAFLFALVGVRPPDQPAS